MSNSSLYHDYAAIPHDSLEVDPPPAISKQAAYVERRELFMNFDMDLKIIQSK